MVRLDFHLSFFRFRLCVSLMLYKVGGLHAHLFSTLSTISHPVSLFKYFLFSTVQLKRTIQFEKKYSSVSAKRFLLQHQQQFAFSFLRHGTRFFKSSGQSTFLSHAERRTREKSTNGHTKHTSLGLCYVILSATALRTGWRHRNHIPVRAEGVAV